MKRAFVLAPLASLLLLAPFTALADLPAPPPTRVENVTETVQGVSITDPYRWLEDQQSPETRAWITAQNAYTDQIMAGSRAVRRSRRGSTQLLKVDASGVPVEVDGRYFFTRRSASQDHRSCSTCARASTGSGRGAGRSAPMSTDLTTSVSFVD